jgi:enoyl-CoA hydratase/carnithine racemase
MLINYQKKENIAVITLNRPGHGNAINTKMVQELADIGKEICFDNGVRIIVLTGEGKDAFSVGTDPEELIIWEKGNELPKRLSISSLVVTMDRPVLAAINGDALGQGLELALACDLRICGGNGRFAMPQVSHGVIPWDGGTQLLARLIGRGKAIEMILTGETIDAREAYRIGLVHKVIPIEELMPTVMRMAREMASKAPISLKFCKEAIYKGVDMTLDQGLHLESDLYSLIHTTRDRIEGIMAFRERRAAKFEGK